MSDIRNAAHNLVGKELPGGWTVTEKIVRRVDATGGHFSISYRVKGPNGEAGFCKVLDLRRALYSPDPARVLQNLTESYNAERDLLRLCGSKRLSRIVVALHDGVVTLPDYEMATVNFIIFETADDDIRGVLNHSDEIDVVVRLRCLHHVATGLQQLHKIGGAHQDVKPSNILVFNAANSDHVSKLGDLGRASLRTRDVWHDDLDIVGDPTYAPPEQLYGATPIEFGPRRLACDLYQLGSLACFLFTNWTVNALLARELHPSLHWAIWNGTYAEVRQYVADALGRAVEDVRDCVPEVVADDVVQLVKSLCNPDPALRGYTGSALQSAPPYALDRVVTRLDLLARRVANLPVAKTS